MFYTGNPDRDFDRWEAKQERRLAELPRCSDCDNPIQQDTAVYINGEWLCDECLDSYRRGVEDCI